MHSWNVDALREKPAWPWALGLAGSALLALLLVAGPAPAADNTNNANNTGYVPLDEAITAARKKQDGKVLSATSEPKKGQYKIKVLSEDGVVRVIKVDAKTGKVVGK